MEPLDEWLSEVDRRQRNVDPIGRIPNVANFHGTLIKGNRKLNGMQRVGALAMGLGALTWSCVLFSQIVGALTEASALAIASSLSSGIFAPLSLWFGPRITLNALINDPPSAGPSPDQE